MSNSDHWLDGYSWGKHDARALALLDLADALEHEEAEKFSGPIYGYFRRSRARYFANWLRRQIDS